MPFSNSPVSPRVDAAAGRMRRLLNDGMLGLLAAVGARAGLLGALRRGAGPVTAVDLAATTGLERPLVDSWLAAMVAGRIVDYDGAHATYALPDETAVFLSSAEGRAFSQRLQQLWALATTEQMRRLGAGGGPAAEPALDQVLALVPGLAERLRRRPTRVLELGCGDGFFTCALAAAHRSARCTGRDARRDGIRAARRLAHDRRLANARFTCGRVLPPPSSAAKYDLVVSLDDGALSASGDAVRLAQVLAPDGVAVLSVTATTDSPADDALHPFGAYLHGARALAAAPLPPPSAELGARLATAGLGVSALCRLPGDGFRNFLIVNKQPQPHHPRTGDRS